MSEENLYLGKFEQFEFDMALEDGVSKTVQGIALPEHKGLCVAMPGFGFFNVSHAPSGLKITSFTERFGNALLTYVRLITITQTVSFDWADPETAKDFIKEHGHMPVPFEGATSTGKFGTRPLTVREWLAMKRCSFPGEDFPWEEQSPLDIAMDELEKLEAA